MRRVKLLSIIIMLLIIQVSVCSSANLLENDECRRMVMENDSWWNHWTRDKNHNNIDDLIEDLIKKSDSDRISIYIDYNHKPTECDIKLLTSFNLEIEYIVKCINTIILKNVKISDILEISRLNGVVMVELRHQPNPNLDVSTPAIKARESNEYSPLTAWELGYTGAGINIAIIDAGVDDGHESLEGKFVAGVDLTQRESILAPRDGTYNPDDDESPPYGGHGTYCAGIAMGTGGSDGQYKGVAIDARLIDIKAYSSKGAHRLEAYDWVIEHKDVDWNGNGPDDYDGIDVISESYGSGWISELSVSDGQDAASRAANEVVEAGIVFITSIGNDGPDNEGIEPPASADNVISVGSVDDYNTVNREDDVIADTSSRGPRDDDGDEDPYDELKPDVVAPGRSIMSTNHAPVGQTGTGYSSVSGTSFAAPHVAGLVALLLDANNDLLPSDIKEILHHTSEARGEPSYPDLDPKYNTAYGYGIVDAYEGVRIALGYDPSADGGGIIGWPEPVDLYPPTSITEHTMVLLFSEYTDNDFSKYEVHISITPNFMPSESTEVAFTFEKSVTTYEVHDLEEDTTYYFKIRVYNNNFRYSDSNEVQGTTLSSKDGSFYGITMDILSVVILSIIAILIISSVVALSVLRKRKRDQT